MLIWEEITGFEIINCFQLNNVYKNNCKRSNRRLLSNDIFSSEKSIKSNNKKITKMNE